MSSSNISAKLRRQVAQKFHRRCAYCQSQEVNSGMQFTIDHIIPDSLGGPTKLANLCLCCWDCNLIKQNRIAGVDPQTNQEHPLFNPSEQSWSDHFEWINDGLLVLGKTAVGRATVHLLRLNRPILLQARKRWIAVGWHPPSD